MPRTLRPSRPRRKQRNQARRRGDVLQVRREKRKRSKTIVFAFFFVGLWQCIRFNSNFITSASGVALDWTKSAFNDTLSLDAPLITSGKAVESNKKTNLRTLWLTTCETNHNSSIFQAWNRSAHRFRNLHDGLEPSNLEITFHSNLLATKTSTALERRGNDASTLWRVEVRNVCNRITQWKGMKTKVNAVLNFVNDTKDADNSPQPMDLVMFTDSDSLFNAMAWNVNQVITQFELARMQKPTLFSAESGCYVGGACSRKYLHWLYPNATKRSSCPQFLNSGQYMGSPQAVREVLQWVSKELGNGKGDDQRHFAIYNRNHPEMISLDYRATLFRSMTFGMVNAKDRGPRTCGTDGIQSCGTFQPFIKAFGDKATGRIVIEAVPGDCQESSSPFSIHFPGKRTKGNLKKVARAVDEHANSVADR